MDWIGGATEAASAGHDVVMTPTAYCYFDFYQSTNQAAEPKAAAWGGPLDVEQNVFLRTHAHQCAAGIAIAHPRRPG